MPNEKDLPETVEEVVLTSEGAEYELYTPSGRRDYLPSPVEEIAEPVELPTDDRSINRAVADLVGVMVAYEHYTPHGLKHVLPDGSTWNPAGDLKDAKRAACLVGYDAGDAEPRDICLALLSRK